MLPLIQAGGGGGASGTFPSTSAKVSSQWLDSYSSVTGLFTKSQPAFTDISGSVAPSQLPNPSATTLGGIESLAAVGSKWINAISTLGVPSATQPAFTDISGSVSAAQLPNPSATTLGGIESLAAVTSKWINAISTSGVPSATQPAFSDISGQASLTTQVSGVLPPANGGIAVINSAGVGGFFAPWGDFAGLIGSSTAGVAASGVVRCIQFVLTYQVTFTKMNVNVNATLNGSNAMVAIYDSSKNKIVQGVFALTASTGGYTVTVASTTLNPGVYWLAWGQDNGTVNLLAAGNASTNGTNIFNKNVARIGTAANTSSTTVMPSALGVVTAGVPNPAAVYLEP